MPYISEDNRWSLDEVISELALALDGKLASTGEVNYTITKILLKTLLAGNARYDDYNRALGVLEAVKLEMYRRSAAPYEDKQVIQHGDVY
jgi:hypothetical protein